MRQVFKRNNPLNIRFSEANNWQGQIGSDNGFCVFENSDYGFRAGFMLIKTYHKKGIRTIEKIIKRFAPPVENPTYSYIEYISRWMESLGYDNYGTDLDITPLDLGNDMIVVDLITGMAQFESGKKIQVKAVKSALHRLGVISIDDEPLGVRGVPKMV